MDTNSKSTTNITINHSSEEFFEENIDQDNTLDIDEIQGDSMDDKEVMNNSFDNLEISDNDDISTNVKNLLHQYTNISTEEFCSKLLSFFRESHTCKSHANRLLSFMHSTLPIPNAAPNSIENVLETLQIENNRFRKYMLCTICNTDIPLSERFCSKCSTSDNKCFALIYDMDVEQPIRRIYTRLKTDIAEYREHLQTMNDKDKTNDIGFNNIYQQLVKENINENFITFLLHLDGISLPKSSNLKMRLCSGSIIELRPQLRKRRFNMVLFSFWSSYKEPDAQIWLKNCIDLIKFIKIKGDCVTVTARFFSDLLDLRELPNKRKKDKNVLYPAKNPELRSLSNLG